MGKIAYKKLNRVTINQYLIDKYNYKKYLEIGAYKGESLLPLKHVRKIAIDPDFQISIKKKVKWIIKNPTNFFNHYFEMPSKEFFKKKEEWLNKKGKQDLVFIDGLHTFEGSLNDVLNSIRFLNKDGFIIIHDCLPPNAAAATPAKSLEDADTMNIPGWKKEWCGDVWKTILYLQEEFPGQLEVYTIDSDYGLGVVRVLDPNLNLAINKDLFNKIIKLNYEDLEQNLNKYLNLKNQDYIFNS